MPNFWDIERSLQSCNFKHFLSIENRNLFEIVSFKRKKLENFQMSKLFSDVWGWRWDVCVKQEIHYSSSAYLCWMIMEMKSIFLSFSFNISFHEKRNKESCWSKAAVQCILPKAASGLQATRQNDEYEKKTEQNWLCRFHATKHR